MIRWGILGLGRAGRARARAIQACEHSVLVAGFRGDPASFGLTPSPTVEALFAECDAVAVCSPDPTHPQLVRAALDAGRHVVCEYPLAPSRRVARELFALAEARQRILHVEHIELLAGSQQALRRFVAETRVLGGTLHDQPSASGGVGRSPLSRLHRLVDLFGLPERVSRGKLSFGTLEVRRETPVGPGSARTGPGLSLRTARGLLGLERGRLTLDGAPVPLEPTPGLFALDHAFAVRRILEGGDPYVSEERVLSVLEILESWCGGQPR